MERRRLGRTGLQVGVLGLGTEYLVCQSRKTVVSVFRQAVEAGTNYIDVLFAYAEYLDNIGAALDGIREDVYITGHLGSGEKDGQYERTRDPARCEALFEDVLRRAKTDHVDVVMLSNCDKQDDYDTVISEDGLLGRRLVSSIVMVNASARCRTPRLLSSTARSKLGMADS